MAGTWDAAYRRLWTALRGLGSKPGFEPWAEEWATAELRRCGSTVTGLYVQGQSDLDVTLFFPGRRHPMQRSEQLAILRLVATSLEEQAFEDVNVIGAKAPIVVCRSHGLVLDVSVQSCLGLANTRLVSQYTHECPELRLLVRKVKEFAHVWGVKDAKDGTLSSYAYTLLCIHFLQQRSPPRCWVTPVDAFEEGCVSPASASTATSENADPNAVWAAPCWEEPKPGGYLSASRLALLAAQLPADRPRGPTENLGNEAIVALFAQFAAWLLYLLEDAFAWDGNTPPYVATIRTLDQREARTALARLDRQPYLVVEEPFSGENVARPLTYEGAVKLHTALRKACVQLQTHPLALKLGVPRTLLRGFSSGPAYQHAFTCQ